MRSEARSRRRVVRYLRREAAKGRPFAQRMVGRAEGLSSQQKFRAFRVTTSKRAVTAPPRQRPTTSLRVLRSRRTVRRRPIYTRRRSHATSRAPTSDSSGSSDPPPTSRSINRTSARGQS